MYRKGHIGINMMLFAPVLFIMISLEFVILGIIGFISVVYFASLPDIDLKIKYLTHRGVTHTMSFGILLGIISLIVGLFGNTIFMTIGIIDTSLFNMIFISAYSFFIGFFIVMGHIAGDVITPTGVRLFQKPNYIPNTRIFSDKNYTLCSIPAKSKMANVGFLFLGLLFTSISIFSSLVVLGI